MKKRRKHNVYRLRWKPLVLLIALPLLVRGIGFCAVALGNASESAALLSAALFLPKNSTDLLQEQLRAEIYNPETDESTESEQGEPVESEGTPSQPESASTSEAASAASIPEEYAAPILSEDFSGQEGGIVLREDNVLIRNDTTCTTEDVRKILQTPWATTFADSEEPQILIVHTHATESFEQSDTDTYDVRTSWRNTDNTCNMVAVGDALAQTLEEHGISVLHDTTQHDYPSYNGSYDRSAETIRGYLEQYPSIRVVLDVHRDAMQRDNAIVKPTAVINGKKAAQIMIISACDDGTMDIPNWNENLRFACLLQNHLEAIAPGITRPIFFCYRKYNMDLTTGSLLLEFGSNANTLEEAIYSATLTGEALANLFLECKTE